MTITHDRQAGQAGGRVIHTGQVVIDLTLRVEAVPEPGGDIFADEAGMAVGGGFNVLAASRRFGAQALYAGALGQGPFSDAARAGLRDIGAIHVGATLEGDLGYCVAMTDAQAERTFVSTRGAEAHNPVDAFDQLEVSAQDVLYICGYSLAHESNRAALERLAERLVAEGFPTGRSVLDVSPLVGSLDLSVLQRLGKLGPIWSLNEREAGIMAARLGVSVPGAGDRPGDMSGPGDVPGVGGRPAGVSGASDDSDFEALARELSGRLGRVLVRAGARGSWYAEGEHIVRTESIAVEAVDTNGAGDAHAGVLAAALTQGAAVEDALRWANVAGALSTTRRGPATCPDRAAILARA